MHPDQPYIDLDMARVCLTAGNLVQVRIRGDVRIDVRGLLESMQARRELLPGAKGPILFIAHGNLDWEPTALQTDFFSADVETITGVGVLVDSRVLTLVANMYFGLFPARFPTKVANEESEIRSWLAALPG